MANKLSPPEFQLQFRNGQTSHDFATARHIADFADFAQRTQSWTSSQQPSDPSDPTPHVSVSDSELIACEAFLRSETFRYRCHGSFTRSPGIYHEDQG